MDKENCENGKCEITVGDEKYKQLENDILKILVPIPEQRNPTTWAFATSRRTVNEITEVVKKFIVERLVEYIREKK